MKKFGGALLLMKNFAGKHTQLFTLFLLAIALTSLSAKAGECDKIWAMLWKPSLDEAEFLGMNYSRAMDLAQSEHQSRPYYELSKLSHFVRTAPNQFFESLASLINNQGKAGQALDRDYVVREALKENQLSASEDLIDYLVADLPESRWTSDVNNRIIRRIDPIQVKLAVNRLSNEEIEQVANSMYGTMKNIALGRSRQDMTSFRNRTTLSNLIAGSLQDSFQKTFPNGVSVGDYIKWVERVESKNSGENIIRKTIRNSIGAGDANNLTAQEVKIYFRKRLIGRADQLRLDLASHKSEITGAIEVGKNETSVGTPSTGAHTENNGALKLSKKERKTIQASLYQLRKAAGLQQPNERPESVRELVRNQEIESVPPVTHFVPWNEKELSLKIQEHALDPSNATALLTFFQAKDFASEKRSALRLLQKAIETNNVRSLSPASVQKLSGLEISELRPSSGFVPIRIYFGEKNGKLYLIAAANKRREGEWQRIRDAADKEWKAMKDKLP